MSNSSMSISSSSSFELSNSTFILIPPSNSSPSVEKLSCCKNELDDSTCSELNDLFAFGFGLLDLSIDVFPEPI